jgi:hypothetical protein
MAGDEQTETHHEVEHNTSTVPQMFYPVSTLPFFEQQYLYQPMVFGYPGYHYPMT